MLIEDINSQLKRTVTYVLDDVIEEDALVQNHRSFGLLRGSTIISKTQGTVTQRSRNTPAMPDIETESEHDELHFTGREGEQGADNGNEASSEGTN